ncbi:MAG: hypothetical protein EOP06_02210, partial [Proteobacteria bacterium]
MLGFWVAGLMVRNFHGYKGFNVKIDRGLTIIHGANQNGKSSFVKALCFAMTGSYPYQDATFTLDRARPARLKEDAALPYEPTGVRIDVRFPLSDGTEAAYEMSRYVAPDGSMSVFLKSADGRVDLDGEAAQAQFYLLAKMPSHGTIKERAKIFQRMIWYGVEQSTSFFSASRKERKGIIESMTHSPGLLLIEEETKARWDSVKTDLKFSESEIQMASGQINSLLETIASELGGERSSLYESVHKILTHPSKSREEIRLAFIQTLIGKDSAPSSGDLTARLQSHQGLLVHGSELLSTARSVHLSGDVQALIEAASPVFSASYSILGGSDPSVGIQSLDGLQKALDSFSVKVASEQAELESSMTWYKSIQRLHSDAMGAHSNAGRKKSELKLIEQQSAQQISKLRELSDISLQVEAELARVQPWANEMDTIHALTEVYFENNPRPDTAFGQPSLDGERSVWLAIDCSQMLIGFLQKLSMDGLIAYSNTLNAVTSDSWTKLENSIKDLAERQRVLSHSKDSLSLIQIELSSSTANFLSTVSQALPSKALISKDGEVMNAQVQTFEIFLDSFTSASLGIIRELGLSEQPGTDVASYNQDLARFVGDDLRRCQNASEASALFVNKARECIAQSKAGSTHTQAAKSRFDSILRDIGGIHATNGKLNHDHQNISKLLGGLKGQETFCDHCGSEVNAHTAESHLSRIAEAIASNYQSLQQHESELSRLEAQIKDFTDQEAHTAERLRDLASLLTYFARKVPLLHSEAKARVTQLQSQFTQLFEGVNHSLGSVLKSLGKLKPMVTEEFSGRISSFEKYALNAISINQTTENEFIAPVTTFLSEAAEDLRKLIELSSMNLKQTIEALDSQKSILASQVHAKREASDIALMFSNMKLFPSFKLMLDRSKEEAEEKLLASKAPLMVAIGDLEASLSQSVSSLRREYKSYRINSCPEFLGDSFDDMNAPAYEAQALVEKKTKKVSLLAANLKNIQDMVSAHGQNSIGLKHRLISLQKTVSEITLQLSGLLLTSSPEPEEEGIISLFKQLTSKNIPDISLFENLEVSQQRFVGYLLDLKKKAENLDRLMSLVDRAIESQANLKALK